MRRYGPLLKANAKRDAAPFATLVAIRGHVERVNARGWTVGAPIPMDVRLRFGHAAVQVAARRCRADLLHIKGVAMDPEVRAEGRVSTDVDVLVRPVHVVPLLEQLRHDGWTVVTGFQSSSAFEHSATLTHPSWGYLDVHRMYPGLTLPEEVAFERLWSERVPWTAAGVEGYVPSVTAQKLLLLLHAARSGGSGRAQNDVDHVWGREDEGPRAAIRSLAHSLGADVALAAATGELYMWRHDRSHDLWSAVSTGGSRVQEWRARFKAAPNLAAKLHIAQRALLVNTDHVAMVRGHRPTHREVLVEFLARPFRGLREEAARRRR